MCILWIQDEFFIYLQVKNTRGRLCWPIHKRSVIGQSVFGSSVTDSLQDPFTDVLEKVKVTDPFIKNWLNLLCFLLQGLPSDGTTTAVMAYMIADWCRPVRRCLSAAA